MKSFIRCLSLALAFFLLAPSALADEHDDDGIFLMGEVAYLELPGDDYTIIYRGLVGYTFEVGFQLGGGLTGFYLKRPCAPDPAAEPVGVCPASEEPSDSSSFAGPSPMAGWDIELVEDWLGLELTVIPTFPVTTGSKGWAIEAGANAYFSFEGASDGDFDLALMAGIKYGHFDIYADQYKLRRDEILPAAGLMGQF